jgi:EAL domain-containing protein (putative c-di-GMP-specific phosphodiesterase class I)
MTTASKSVLVVDDETGMLRMLKTALNHYGFVTDEASDGREALELVRKKSFDVIVSDINMPRYPGLEFLRGVREHDADVPVIMMTGKPTVESSARSVEYGAFRYLIKPVMPSALKEAVDHAVRRHEIARVTRRALESYGMDRKTVEDLAALELRFERGMDGLWVAFQPVVSWSKHTVYGYEALVRSTEPSLSSPDLLLGAAERLGKLPGLARAIRWRASRVAPPDGAKLFVNLHPEDLMDEDLYSRNSPLSRLADQAVLELTERAPLDTIEDFGARLERLRRLGFQIALDDLGAGHAGLSALTRLGPDIAKIDMSLIRNIDSEPKKQIVVARVQEMCRDLGVLVVAEGIETPAERDTLVGLGCDKLQGFLFARPAAGFPAVSW